MAVRRRGVLPRDGMVEALSPAGGRPSSKKGDPELAEGVRRSVLAVMGQSAAVRSRA